MTFENFAPNDDAYSNLINGGKAGTLSLENLSLQQFSAWSKKVEDEIRTELRKIEVLKNYQHLHEVSNLLFIWEPMLTRVGPIKIKGHMGIPETPEQFLTIQASGMYEDTPAASFVLTPKVDATDSSGQALSVKIGNNSVQASKEAFTLFFGGNLNHVDEGVTFPQWFNAERANRIRLACRLAANIVIDKLPRQMKGMFLTNAFKRWQEVINFISGMMSFTEDKPNILRFIAFAKFIQNPIVNKFTMESKVIAGRIAFSNFMNRICYTGTTDLAEFKGDKCLFKGNKDVYSPLVNLLFMGLCSGVDAYPTWKQLLEEIAVNLHKQVEELDLTDVLEHKKLIYTRFNAKHGVKKDYFDLSSFEDAFGTDPANVVSQFGKDREGKRQHEKLLAEQYLSLIHISSPRDGLLSRMPSSA